MIFCFLRLSTVVFTYLVALAYCGYNFSFSISKSLCSAAPVHCKIFRHGPKYLTLHFQCSSAYFHRITLFTIYRSARSVDLFLGISPLQSFRLKYTFASLFTLWTSHYWIWFAPLLRWANNLAFGNPMPVGCCHCRLWCVQCYWQAAPFSFLSISAFDYCALCSCLIYMPNGFETYSLIQSRLPYHWIHPIHSYRRLKG